MTNTTPPPGNGPGLPELAEGYKDSVQPGFEKYQRTAGARFPHGYEAWIAAGMIYDFLVAIEDINEGSLSRSGKSIMPMAHAAKSLALALADALETVDLRVET